MHRNRFPIIQCENGKQTCLSLHHSFTHSFAAAAKIKGMHVIGTQVGLWANSNVNRDLSHINSWLLPCSLGRDAVTNSCFKMANIWKCDPAVIPLQTRKTKSHIWTGQLYQNLYILKPSDVRSVLVKAKQFHIWLLLTSFSYSTTSTEQRQQPRHCHFQPCVLLHAADTLQYH